MKLRKSKMALLAATAIGAGFAHVAPAHAAASFEHAIVEDAGRVNAAPAATHEDRAIAAKRAGLVATFIAAGAALIALFGPRKFARAMANGAAAAATASVKAAKTAGATIAKAAKSPLRSLAVFASLVIFALTGVSVFDLEWAAGLATGAAIMLMIGIGSARVKRSLVPARVRKAKVNPQKQP